MGCKVCVSRNLYHSCLLGSPTEIPGIPECGLPVVDCIKYANMDELELERAELSREEIVELSRGGMGSMTVECSSEKEIETAKKRKHNSWRLQVV